MRIVFMGTPDFATGVLQALVEKKFPICGVITSPDKPAGRGQKMKQSSVKQFALKNNLAILQPASLKDTAFINELEKLKPELQVVVAFRMLPEEVWQLPVYGTINLHASLLPQYRGAAPINRVIINGEKQTGVTTFFIEHTIDTGNIIYRETLSIGDNETAGELHNRLMIAGANLVIKTVNAIESGTCPRISQSSLIEAGEVLKPAPKLFKDDCRINWERPAGEIFNQVRGLSPYPGAWTEFISTRGDKTIIKIFWSTIEWTSHELLTGTIVTDSKTILRIAVHGGFIHLKQVQQAGKNKMNIEDFLRGFHIKDYQQAI